MGLEIKKNSEGLYSLTSTNTGESWHPDKEWITEDEVKIMLIDEAFFNFIDKVIEIDMDFPSKYRINDICNPKDNKFNQWMLNAMNDKENYDSIITEKFEEIYKRLKLTFKI